jgi:GTPase SAR1 family protein
MKILDRPQTVFLSGTNEMKHIFNALYEKLPVLNFEPIWYQKKFELDSDDAVNECFRNVVKADRFIITIGKTYGSIYTKTMCSITEQEFNIAYDHSKPILIFIQSAVYHQFKIYLHLKQENKKLLKSRFKELGFEAEPEIYEFLFRIHNKRYEGIRKVPWISQFENMEEIEHVIKDKWVINKYDFTDKKFAIKMIFTGLDGAGKTSILIALREKFDYERETTMPLPTRGIQRNGSLFLGKAEFDWDFGGQKSYRDIYFKRKDLFLDSNLVFFVIDVQEQKRSIEALDYYKEIINVVKETNVCPFPVIILFHKYDPNLPLHKKTDIDKQLEILKYTILEISEDIDVYFFNTSIFDIVSLLDCYSSGLSLILDENETFQVLFNEISSKYNVLMMTLFDNNGITIGEYYKPFLNISKKFKLYEYILNAQKMIKEDKSKTFNFSGNFENNIPFSGSVERIKIGGLTFYLLFIVEKQQKKKDVLRTIKRFKPQIESFFKQVTPYIFSN